MSKQENKETKKYIQDILNLLNILPKQEVARIHAYLQELYLN